MITALEQELKNELTKLNQMRADIIKDTQERDFDASNNPDLWRNRDGTFVLMPITECRSRILLALALERNSNKK